jgi:hypothetical protein
MGPRASQQPLPGLFHPRESVLDEQESFARLSFLCELSQLEGWLEFDSRSCGPLPRLSIRLSEWQTVAVVVLEVQVVVGLAERLNRLEELGLEDFFWLVALEEVEDRQTPIKQFQSVR